jgi:hypothetical protein
MSWNHELRDNLVCPRYEIYCQPQLTRVTPCRNEFMGECSKEQSFAILDAFYKQGGNFLDT